MLRGHDDVTSGLQDFSMRERRSKRRRSGRRDGAFGMMLSSTTDDFSVDGDFLPTAGTSRLQNHGAQADTSPDSKCPICLDKFDNVAHLNQCLHRFCFKCIKEWAKNKAVCPLCKQPFNSIFHTIQAEDDFQEYVLRPAFDGSPAGPRFRYRTTRTRENQLRSSAQRTFSVADNGILFEGFSNVHSQQRGSDIHKMMRRLASRRQASAEGRAMRQIQEQELINFRRALYRSGVRVRNVQGGGRYRDVSAEFFRRNPACLHRLVPWLKRELTVLFGTHGSLVNIVQHIVMSNVTRYDMESQAFAEDLQPFLLHRTNHFIHEFINFARCPYNIEAYDHHANYDCPAPSYEEGSRSESSVITISPDEATSREPDGPSSSLALESAPWDDETPGPSYSTVEQATTSILTTVDSSDEEPSSSRITSTDLKTDSTEGMQDKDLPSDDCVIVGFVKPLAERTPELVELSSDSEASLCEVAIEQTNKSQLKPFMLHGSKGLRRSASLSSSDISNEPVPATKPKRDTSHEKKHSKKQNGSKGASTKSLRKSRNDRAHSSNKEKSRQRARSQSSDCCSRSSRNRAYESCRRRHSKHRLIDKSLEKNRHKNCGEKRRSRSRDRSLSWRSQTVSLTSESSRERGGTSSKSRNHSRGRSRSRDSDNHFPADNYQSSYQFEYTYYSRNRRRDCYEQYSRTRACSKSHYSRLSDSPDYNIKSYSEKKDSKRQRGFAAGKAHHQYRSRSRSSSRMRKQHNQSDKPSGKRKYKTRHLETERKKENSPQIEGAGVKEKCMQPGMTSTDRSSGGHKDDVIDTSSKEPKRKWRKNTRSPSVEIVYEGKSVHGGKHHKKKKKHKKKHRRDKREHQTRSPAASPFIITIDSESDTQMIDDNSSITNGNRTDSNKNLKLDSTMAVPSQSPSTSATASTTEPVSLEGPDPYSKGYDLFSSNGHLDAATGILDGLHFDDSSDEPALPTTNSPPKVESPFSEEAAMAESPVSDLKSEHDIVTSTLPIVITDSQESFAENSQETFVEAISEALEL